MSPWACINRSSGPSSGVLLEGQPPRGVSGQKFTGVERPAGEPTGVAFELSEENCEAGFRPGAQGHDVVREIVGALLGVYTDGTDAGDEGVLMCLKLFHSSRGPRGVGQKFTGVARPTDELAGVEVSEVRRGGAFLCGAHGQTVLRQVVTAASLGVLTAAWEGVVGILRAPTKACTGS